MGKEVERGMVKRKIKRCYEALSKVTNFYSNFLLGVFFSFPYLCSAGSALKSESREL